MATLRKMLGSADHPVIISLMKLIETQSSETLIRWSVNYAESHYLPIIEERRPQEERPGKAVEAVGSYLNQEMSLKDLKPFLADSRKAAQEIKDDPIAQAAARAVSTACSTAQTITGALGFTFYGAAASAYAAAGLSEKPEVYDELATAEFERIFQSLKSVAVPDEENPVRVKWNC